MSFFGLDPNRGHPSGAPGFSQASDPFAGLSRGRAKEDDDDDDGIDFDDTYDGLGDQLEDANDDFNNDTFGGVSSGATKPVGKDFDFFGRTASVSNAITEEQMMYSRQQAPPKSVASIAASPPKPTTKPTRTGYERYREPSIVSDLKADPSLWGAPSPALQSGGGQQMGQGHIPPQPSKLGAGRKMMSLEEVEAQMRTQAKQPGPTQTSQQQQHQQQLQQLQRQNRPPPQMPQMQHDIYSHPGDASQYPQQQQSDQKHIQRQQQQRAQHPQTSQVELPAPVARAPHILQRPQQAMPPFPENGNQEQHHQGAQNAMFQSANQGRPIDHHQPRVPPVGPAGFPSSQQIITHPEQLMQLSEEDRAAFLIEDAKRAKRNHKIFLLSKDNGLMTPQDKNFVTRIQLQQLMTATGNVNEHDPDAALSEDFYYQVHSQIRGGPRQNPHQPLNTFAQTYLFQTGGRQAGFNRRQNRAGDNHMQRMEQQVQRAVEAAKLKPKNKQLVIEGSLGKISFSNAKTPKPLLNIKRHESGDPTNRSQSTGRQANARKAQPELSSSDRKSVLASIESVYSTLMKMEDDLRKEPPPPSEESDAGSVQQHMEWRHGMQTLNEKLWDELRVPEPINPGSSVPHPFIAILSYAKGKKIIPRVFRHLSTEQRVIMLTMIVLHLDILDVVRLGQLQPGETQLPAAAREAIDLFSAAVTPSLFSYVSEAPLFNVIGLLGLILSRVNVQAIAHTRVGLSILTMLTSRATLVKEAGGTNDSEWEQWSQSYNRLFDVLEPTLGDIFPGSVNTGEDVYVWQFLAAIGSGASPEQQQRLVLAVKDRVMETVQQSKTLPPDMASQRLGTVNLFMRGIGLDVELLG